MTKFTEALARIEVDADKPSRMIIRGPDGRPLADADGSMNYVDLYSPDSEIARRHQRKIANGRLAQRRRIKVTAEEIEADAVDLLVALTAGWGSIDKDGQAKQDDDFSTELARSIYADPANSEFRSQIDEFLADRANFSKASSKS